MSFVPAPQQANATGTSNASLSEKGASAPDEDDVRFKRRTFDVTWVEKSALMYKEGITKSYDRVAKKTMIDIKQKSSIPIILRDMAPPEGSIFNPAEKWKEEKERRVAALQREKEAQKAEKKKSGKSKQKKQSTAESIIESNMNEKLKKDHKTDLQKLSNLRSLKALQDASCETESGKIHRMIKMLHLAVCDLKEGSVNSSEAEVLDILWALEEMPTFSPSEKEIDKEKQLKKEQKAEEKSKKKDKKSKKDKKEKKEKVVLSAEAQTLKTLLKEGADSRGGYKDSLKYARKLMASKTNLISFQLTEMPDRLPPLSRYNRKFKLEGWQCDVLEAIDAKRTAVVCAPTSSGKTLLSTYTCHNLRDGKGTVLFVLPSEVLVWQVAATYYEFFKGNVTVCTDLITFQEITGDPQVYIGTPRALELSITKARGCAGQEMVKAEKEFMVLDGGYNKFDYLVLDEVHTLNGPEGDALQRIIKSCNTPCLALSATIGNAVQLQQWFKKIRNEHVAILENPKPEDVTLKEHFARFINLQRYVVTESESKSGKKTKLVKLHPVAAMTQERLRDNSDLIASLSMTPMDMIDLWKRMRSIFPNDVLEEMDDPDNFFKPRVGESKRITLDQTKEYEIHLKSRLAVLSQSYPELYERLRVAQIPPPLTLQHDVSDMIYGVVNQLKQSDLLPAVAFQLDTYGSFNMFRSLLSRLESEQVAEFPKYRKDLIKLAREKAAMRKVAAGKSRSENAVEMEEDAKMGLTDDLLIQEDTTKPHDKYVLSSAGKRLSYAEVDDIMADMKKSGERVDINHALIRGLRRGIAIYTNEVGFACYRRQVQMLAQKGRIAVVFSDTALAYGVNMPFRTCVFCGHMGTQLTPLIAQQMQGRAGRRGMDVQGNVIYLGMDWPYIENLMLGQISQVVGKEPRYPIMVLQQALAASNDPDDTLHFIHDDVDGENKGAFGQAIRKLQRSQNCYPTVSETAQEWMCSTSLHEFCDGKETDYYLALSKRVIVGLGYVEENLRLKMDHNVLSMVWEMHDYLPHAIHLAAVLDQLYIRFCYNKTKNFKESDATQNDFLAVLCHVVDRVPVKQGEESLQQLLKVESYSSEKSMINEDTRAMWLETETTLSQQQRIIQNLDIPQSEKDKMHLPIPPGVTDCGPPLDKGVYEMLVSKQKGFRDEQSAQRRNELKDRIFHLGHICMIAHNNIQQPHSKYNSLEVHFRRMFSNIKYSIADMMNQLTDQYDVTEV